MRLIYVNSSKVTKLEQKMNNSESFLLLLKNLLKCTYEVLLPSQRGVLPWVRNSYITPVQGLLFNIGCLRRHITSLLSDVRMTSVFINMTDVDAEYFKVKLNLLKRWHPKVCKKKYPHVFDERIV